MAVSHTALLPAINGIVQDSRLQTVDTRLQLGKFYVLTLPGSLAVGKRRHQHRG